MMKFLDKMLAWVVSGIFLAGLYSIGHFVFRLDDSGILAIAGFLIWEDMAKSIRKDDAKESNPAINMCRK